MEALAYDVLIIGGFTMPKTLPEWKEFIQSCKGKQVDIIYHPHASYRMIKEGDAIVRGVYANFFEVEIITDLYGSYRTTIRYVDLYTGACKIALHQDKVDVKECDR